MKNHRILIQFFREGNLLKMVFKIIKWEIWKWEPRVEAAVQKCFYEKLFWKYTANLQTPMPKCNFNKVAQQLY